MAQNQQEIECPSGVWTQLTNSDAASATFQVLRGPAYIRFTTDGTAPAADLHGLLYDTGQGEANRPPSDIVNLASAARIWARPAGNRPALLFVDHS